MNYEWKDVVIKAEVFVSQEIYSELMKKLAGIFQKKIQRHRKMFAIQLEQEVQTKNETKQYNLTITPLKCPASLVGSMLDH